MLNILSDRSCAAKPTKPVEKRFDGGGLYLLVKVRKDGNEETISRIWQFDYSRPGVVNAKGKKLRNTLGYGAYPEVTLEKARQCRDEARDQLRDGKDPGQQKVQEVILAIAAGRTFADEAEEFYESQLVAKGRRGTTLRRYKLTKDQLVAKFGKRPLGLITSTEVKGFLQDSVIDCSVDKALRQQTLMRRILERAKKQKRCSENPLEALDGEWTAQETKPLAFTRDEEKLGKLLRDIRNSKRLFAAKAVEMMALTFPRPNNINAMQWAHIDLDGAVWTIPKDGIGGMKMDREHVVPLSRQAIEILKSLQPLTGDRKFVFSRTDKPLTHDAMMKVMKETGLSADEHTAHGFRKTAATLLHEETNWYPRAIEIQLAHARPSGETAVHGIYNKAEYMDVRILMMQHWADRLDAMREGRTNVVPLVKAA